MKCTNPACTAEVHWKARRCKACGAEQARGQFNPEPAVELDDGDQDSVGRADAEAAVHSPAAATDQPAAPDELSAFEQEPYVCLEDFRLQIGNVNCPFTQGQVISDFQTLNIARELKMPIVPASKAFGMVCCPNCKTVFASAGKGAVPLSRSAA